MNDNFRLLCQEKDVRVAQVSRDTGIPLSTLNAWANGTTSTLKDKNAAKLADYFSVSVDYLMGREKEKPVTPKGDELKGIDAELYDLFKGLTPEQAAKVRAFIAGIKA